MPRIAFYAPLKPPDHPVPSGDREMARLLVKALERAGFEVETASALRSYNPGGDADFSAEAQAEIDRLLVLYRERCLDLWFTYHVYYKAPDLIGPAIAKALGIPYVIAEGSRAPKRSNGPWARGNAQADAALAAADIILIPNPRDRAMLEAVKPEHQRLLDFPPFLDSADWPHLDRTAAQGRHRFLAVAMLREGDKAASYEVLAQALALLKASAWHLDIVGDGPMRPQVEAMFAPFGTRIRFHGRIDDRAELARFYAQADLLLWPAVNEAFGMVFLEAALQGCPSIAGDFGGVGTVVRDGETGLLCRPGDARDFAWAVESVMADAILAEKLSTGAARFAQEERSLGSAALLLRKTLML